MAATALNLQAAASVCHFVFDANYLRSENQHSLRHMWQIVPKLPRFLVAHARLTRRYKGAFPNERPFLPLRAGLNIVYAARALQPDTPLIDETFRFVGPSINRQTRNEEFPFDRLNQQPLVYISLGTIHHGQAQFYRQCFAAFADYPAQFVLSAGSDTVIEALGVIPPNFIVRPSVPQLDLLERGDLFITHGGINSIHEGLYYGVPLVVIPQQIEQLLNARCVERQGAGLTIDTQLAGKEIRPTELRQALEQVLGAATYRQAAHHMREKLRATGGYRQAADEIQAYLGE